MAIFLVVASITAVLWFGASAVVSGEITGGRLGQFVLYALFAAGAMAELSECLGRDEPGRRFSRTARRAVGRSARDLFASASHRHADAAEG